MDVDSFLDEIRSGRGYADQIVYTHQVERREARYAQTAQPLSEAIKQMLATAGIDQLYAHQAAAIDILRAQRNVVIATGTASGKSLCYQIPLIETLLGDPAARAILMFPTKALCQDQFKSFRIALDAAGCKGVMAGVYDGDTPAALRRKLRSGASVIFTNPDMLHAGIMSQHGRWAEFLAGLKFIVLDELHTYSGVFGANLANMLRRFERLWTHYDTNPLLAACSATIANPRELASELTGREFELVDADGSSRGRRTYVFWNPPKRRNTNWRSRKSSNVEAHELMAQLVRRGISTITFAKSRMTAEMIHRYVTERLQQTAPHLAGKVSPYRGGYLPADRREIERKLFSGELLGVSTTNALELGIDVGSLDACIVVGYPGTLASFMQQSGRAGRGDRDTLIILIGMDTTVNQYIMTHPEYLFDRPIEQAVIEPDNPFVTLGHLRCAAHELPLEPSETASFGPDADLVLDVLAGNHKLKKAGGKWYHASNETPQHEVQLRGGIDANVMLTDAETGEIFGEIDRYDAEPIVHPGAVYMHRGETYLVLDLDMDKNVATLKRQDVAYYTDPQGGTDIHHVDRIMRQKPFGTGQAFWGEVTAYFNTYSFEKIQFYELDAISRHKLNLPTLTLETMGIWLVPPEDLMARVLEAGLEHSGLPGIGYAIRMLLPLLMTCDTMNFSHSVGSVNSPWQSIFIYERYPHGLGFTAKAYENLHILMPMVLEHIKNCPCDDGCPCCVGKSLCPSNTWYVDRHEAWVPSKASSIMILEGMLGDCDNLNNADIDSLSDGDQPRTVRLRQDLRRRLEQMRQPQLFHQIDPQAPQGYPEPSESIDTPDTTARRTTQKEFGKQFRRRLAKKMRTTQLDAMEPKAPHMTEKITGPTMPPTAFSGKPPRPQKNVTAAQQQEAHSKPQPKPVEPIKLGDSLAARAQKLKKKRKNTDD
ncbi:MAG: DEAD/DEAH box helicase [Phycisphaerales bacterium]|jgi:DEAD/DEAH box helicase domain-containing protein|nr:DEAD/DEAH box helicase [Phycisphaerales bacterium]